MDMLVTIDKNTWNGRTSLRIYVKEFKPSRKTTLPICNSSTEKNA